jgi:hypothetical protein
MATDYSAEWIAYIQSEPISSSRAALESALDVLYRIDSTHGSGAQAWASAEMNAANTEQRGKQYPTVPPPTVAKSKVNKLQREPHTSDRSNVNSFSLLSTAGIDDHEEVDDDNDDDNDDDDNGNDNNNENSNTTTTVSSKLKLIPRSRPKTPTPKLSAKAQAKARATEAALIVVSRNPLAIQLQKTNQFVQIRYLAVRIYLSIIDVLRIDGVSKYKRQEWLAAATTFEEVSF